MLTAITNHPLAAQNGQPPAVGDKQRPEVNGGVQSRSIITARQIRCQNIEGKMLMQG